MEEKLNSGWMSGLVIDFCSILRLKISLYSCVVEIFPLISIWMTLKIGWSSNLAFHFQCALAYPWLKVRWENWKIIFWVGNISMMKFQDQICVNLSLILAQLFFFEVRRQLMIPILAIHETSKIFFFMYYQTVLIQDRFWMIL